MQNCTALRLKPASARAEDKARFGLVSYRTLADFIGRAFWQPLRSNTQHLGLKKYAALEF